jgi:hypothetical protein
LIESIALIERNDRILVELKIRQIAANQAQKLETKKQTVPTVAKKVVKIAH